MLKLTKIFLLLLVSANFAQSPLLTLMNDDGSAGYPKTDDLLMAFNETDMTVSEWTDQSGNGYDFAQATTTNQPSLISDALNGYPALRFDGADNIMTQGSVITQNQPITIYLVYKPITWTNNDFLFGIPIFFIGEGYTHETYLYASNYVPYITLTDNQYIILTCQFNGANSLIQRNNESPITGNAGSSRIEIAPLNLGSKGTASYANIEIAALYLHTTAHDEATRTEIINYLNTKYGIF